MIPYTGWIGIEITNNHIINVLLREANNLIHVNENRELYVDLQLEDWIEPDDDFPVGVTTGRILAEDWRPMNGLILNWKTTSGDYARLIIGSDNNVYIDIGDGNWMLLGEGSSIFNCNTRTFYLENWQDLATATEAYRWYKSGKNAIIFSASYMPTNPIYLLYDEYQAPIHEVIFRAYSYDVMNSVLGYTVHTIPTILLVIDDTTEEVTLISHNRTTSWFIDPSHTYWTPFMPTDPSHPTSKQYVDDWLATKQDILTAGTRITIDPVTNVISADMSGVFVYKGNVATVNDLPSWATVWDTYLVEDNWHLYAWDWTQWNDLGNTSIDLTPYFNKITDDSDAITEWSIHLFCTTAEKIYWNNKQDALTAGAGININPATNEISATPYTGGNQITVSWFTINNDAPFVPENTGTLSQVLKRTSTGYKWANESWWRVIDNLLSDSATDALSANQGRILKNMIDQKADLSDIPRVGNWKLTIKVNGWTHEFYANQSWNTVVEFNTGWGWGGWGSDIDVIDNLNSTSSSDALSANQWRVLNEKIEDIASSIIYPDRLHTVDLPSVGTNISPTVLQPLIYNEWVLFRKTVWWPAGAEYYYSLSMWDATNKRILITRSGLTSTVVPSWYDIFYDASGIVTWVAEVTTYNPIYPDSGISTDFTQVTSADEIRSLGWGGMLPGQYTFDGGIQLGWGYLLWWVYLQAPNWSGVKHITFNMSSYIAGSGNRLSTWSNYSNIYLVTDFPDSTQSEPSSTNLKFEVRTNEARLNTYSYRSAATTLNQEWWVSTWLPWGFYSISASTIPATQISQKLSIDFDSMSVASTLTIDGSVISGNAVLTQEQAQLIKNMDYIVFGSYRTESRLTASKILSAWIEVTHNS